MHTYMCVQYYQTMFAYLNNSFLYISAVPQDSCTFIKTYTTRKQLLLSTKGISLALNTDSKGKISKVKDLTGPSSLKANSYYLVRQMTAPRRVVYGLWGRVKLW